MIVKCEQCQTRFKIPDDKVTDKGVKVRCTKCGHTFRVTRDMAQPATATVPAVQMPPAPGPADPFAKFGASPELPPAEVTRPGVFALGVEATRSPDLGARQAGLMPPSYPTAPSIPAATAHTSSSPFDFSSLKPPEAGAMTQPAVPAFNPGPAAAPAPFDFAAIAPPTAAAPAPAASAFDFSSFAAPGTSPGMKAPAGLQPPPPPPPSAPTSPTAPALPAFDFGPPSAPAAPPPMPRSSAPMESVTQQVSSLPDAAGGADGFFASTESSASAISNLDGATARSMFDLPQAPAHQETLPDIPPPEPDPVPQAPSMAAPVAAAATAVARVSAPVKDGDATLGEAPPRRRSVVGIIVNIGIAAVLVFGLVVVGSAYLNEGKISADSLSLESLKNTFAPSVEFVASDVSNGLYETRAGRAVFFVRGEVINHSGNAVKIVVKAELVEGGKVVRSAESWVGEPASPEEIFMIDGAESLDALGRRVEKRAMTIPADAAGAFVVPFTEYPPDLKEFRVRVSARAVAATPTADAR